ncbi:hypothetical protein ASF72_01425 [Arthrobacter sp. Leaf141]|uniref:DUF3846 domain-containing protein n=1 Tax=Arthrobacter sp. Leaf141 TaxID=1736273 RepID=UPI0006FB189D|nr:DUF3846 domain-containing protein [Arthrobacter sp. Leaf141]KQQ96350.1 hypothetical protein ASF72_01425 [Arthrobacter sp. Leaf141]
MSTCKALIIPADPSQPARVDSITADLETLQHLVRGNIEAVSGDNWHFYLNEEGKILGLEPNTRAGAMVLQLTGDLQDVYCGDVVFLGETPDGDEADVPAKLWGLLALMEGSQPPAH